ncbi:MAG: hypothetical protein ACI9MC_001845 [Kiritimatiellia bacterium]|jgi:hypothetical protein
MATRERGAGGLWSGDSGDVTMAGTQDFRGTIGLGHGVWREPASLAPDRAGASFVPPTIRLVKKFVSTTIGLLR